MTHRCNILFTHVSELIDAENGDWDEQTIRENFWQVDAERILKIPLALGMMTDFVSWHYNKNGVFSVKSAYYQEWDYQHGRKLRRTNLFDATSSDPIWKSLWSLKVPAKVKIHCWRAILGAIPCYGVLANRHMQTSSQCPLCLVHCESISHAFFTCPRVAEIWSHLGMQEALLHACAPVENGVPPLIQLLINTNAAPILDGVRLCDLVAVGVWYVWWERRKATHGEPVQDPRRSAQSILALALNYSRIKKNRISPMVRHGWTKPQVDFVKLNVDAAFDSDSGTGGTGAIIRDHTGFFVTGGRWSLQHVEDAATAEGHALRNGLLLAGQVGCNRVIVESDCLEVIQIMKDGGNSLGAAAAIYEECSFLCRSFTAVSFSHCPREANSAADSLAKFVEVEHATWHGDPPVFLRDVITNDVTIVNA